MARFINAPSPSEVIFTRNCTEGINLVANTWGVDNCKEGDEIVLSELEHHSNLLPWQMLAQRTGAVLRFAKYVPEEGRVPAESYRAVVGPRTKLIATAHVSNMLACVAPVEEIVGVAREVGARVLLDAAQSAPHRAIDVQARRGCRSVFLLFPLLCSSRCR